MADTFGSWLKNQAIGRFGTLRAFAKAIGKEPTYISRWVGDHERPSYESARQIADVLAVPIVEVLSRAGMPIHEADALATPPSPDDPLEIMVERVRNDPRMMRDLRRAQEINTPEVFERILHAVADAWRANLRMAMQVNGVEEVPLPAETEHDAGTGTNRR